MLYAFSYRHLLSAGFLIGSAFLLAVTLATFSAHDHSLLYESSCNSVQQSCNNFLGTTGAQCAALLLFLCGSSIWLCVPLLLLSGVYILNFISKKRFQQMAVGLILLLVGQALLSFQMGVEWYNHIQPGGLLGCYLTTAGWYVCEPPVFFMATFLLNCIALFLILHYSWVKPLLSLTSSGVQFLYLHRITAMLSFMVVYPINIVRWGYRTILSRHIYRRYLQGLPEHAHTFQTLVHEHIFEDPFWQDYRILARNSLIVSTQVCDDISRFIPQDTERVIEKTVLHKDTSDVSFIKPVDVLFKNIRTGKQSAEEESLVQERARNLESKLALFGIEGSVVSITTGPVVTLFEYSPARDVKISKIVMLEDDLALALEAHSLRIIAPIPGRSVVGFEVANSNRQTVYFADIVASKEFKMYKGALPLIVGRTTQGCDVIVDLVDMPHLLVAGSTGSGKSVALNAMLTSLLCKVHPDEVRLILIDPKRLEFASFADIPHLIFPIITEVARVPGVLSWAVKIMEERYAKLAAAGVRHISEYHKKHGCAAMPYIVIVIDELADLMMACKSQGGFGSRALDIEGLIARLAQMARAAGIHLVIATQRPSVDVITGLIKVNFPSRIACKVISKIDSRTILDHAGAEKLLGKGDMLFLNHKGVIDRVHGAYVRDEEIMQVVEHVKGQQEVVYEELEQISLQTSDNLVSDEDPLYSDVCAYVTTMHEVSISLLQRKFRIGYNRSARLIDTLEARGIVLPSDGGKFRKVAAKRT